MKQRGFLAVGVAALAVTLSATKAGTNTNPAYDLERRSTVLGRLYAAPSHAELAAALRLRHEHQVRAADAVIREADRQGVPVPLALAIAWSESAFRPHVIGPRPAVGTERAVGLMQVLPSTARTVDPWVRPRDLLHPETGARIGVAYIRRAMDYHGNDPRRVAMAYHGGIQGYRRGIWGPRTRAYAETVARRAARLGLASNPLRMPETDRTMAWLFRHGTVEGGN